MIALHIERFDEKSSEAADHAAWIAYRASQKLSLTTAVARIAPPHSDGVACEHTQAIGTALHPMV